MQYHSSLAIRLRWKVKDKRDEGGDVVSVESFRWEIGFYLGEGGAGRILCFVVIRIGMEGSN